MSLRVAVGGQLKRECHREWLVKTSQQVCQPPEPKYWIGTEAIMSSVYHSQATGWQVTRLEPKSGGTLRYVVGLRGRLKARLDG